MGVFNKLRLGALAAAAATCVSMMAAEARELKVGISLAISGGGASVGLPMQDAIKIFPNKIKGHDATYILLDDAGDVAKAAANARKLIFEEQVDVLIGSNTTPPTAALLEAAAEAKVPLITPMPSSTFVDPVDDKRKWAYQAVLNDKVMSRALLAHMKRAGVKTLGFIGYSDSYGDGYWAQIEAAAPEFDVKIVAREGYNRNDTSVAGQALKLLAANPDAVLIVGGGTGAVLPQVTLKERGYGGKFYQTQGVYSPAFIEAGGKNVEGTILVGSPYIVIEQLPADHPVRKHTAAFSEEFSKAHGKPAPFFSAVTRDFLTLIELAAEKALPVAQPGTVEFREALRAELEKIDGIVLASGTVTMTATNHNGFHEDSVAVIKVEDQKFKLEQ